MSNYFSELTQGINVESLVVAAITLLLGYLLARAASMATFRVAQRLNKINYGNFAERAVFYLIFAIFIINTLEELGFNLSVLLGAAGIVTVALGFASQTTASNLISGLFLIGERPFAVGETIIVNNVQGDIISVDFLSTKLRMPDNTLVRIPNEVLFKTQLINLTRFPIRRFEARITIAYGQEFAKVEQILLEIAKQNNFSLNKPAPEVTIVKLTDTGMHLQLSVWSSQQNYDVLKNSIHVALSDAFNKHLLILPTTIPIAASSLH